MIELALIALTLTTLAALALVWRLTELLPELARHSMVLQKTTTADEAVAAHMALEPDLETAAADVPPTTVPSLTTADGVELEIVHGELPSDDADAPESHGGSYGRRGFLI